MRYRRLASLACLGILLAGASACSKQGGGGASGATAVESKSFGELTVDELSMKMEAARAGKLELYVFDNNPADRFRKSHIAGAKWVAFDKVSANDLPANKDATLVFYCANEH